MEPIEKEVRYLAIFIGKIELAERRKRKPKGAGSFPIGLMVIAPGSPSW